MNLKKYVIKTLIKLGNMLFGISEEDMDPRVLDTNNRPEKFKELTISETMSKIIEGADK